MSGLRIVEMEGARPAPQREVMSLRQAAVYMGVSTDKMYDYLMSGTLPGFKLGNRWKVKRSMLDAWMEQESAKPLAEKESPRRRKTT